MVAGKVWWPETLVMLLAAVVGGYFGARVGRRANQEWLRVAISVLCFGITAAFFLRARP